ncbi:hypothetical protein D3C72_2260640 [compost metagenome]
MSTKEGHLYFAVLTRPDVYGGRDTDNARFYIRDLIQTLTNRNTLVKFPYAQIGNMSPTDKFATLVEIKPAAVVAPLVQPPKIEKMVEKEIETAKAKVSLKKG